MAGEQFQKEQGAFHEPPLFRPPQAGARFVPNRSADVGTGAEPTQTRGLAERCEPNLGLAMGQLALRRVGVRPQDRAGSETGAPIARFMASERSARNMELPMVALPAQPRLIEKALRAVKRPSLRRFRIRATPGFFAATSICGTQDLDEQSQSADSSSEGLEIVALPPMRPLYAP
jgi:hypothetical protein